MKIYAVIDTNVLVSAMLKYTSIPGNIVEFALDGTIIPVLSIEIVKEYREVLSRSKFHLTQNIIEDLISTLEQQGEYIDSVEQHFTLPDPKDVVFYEIVMEKRKSEDAYLVTGNIKHFPHEKYVVTPREMLDILLKS